MFYFAITIDMLSNPPTFKKYRYTNASLVCSEKKTNENTII